MSSTTVSNVIESAKALAYVLEEQGEILRSLAELRVRYSVPSV
jgi:hypothetical protein